MHSQPPCSDVLMADNKQMDSKPQRSGYCCRRDKKHVLHFFFSKCRKASSQCSWACLPSQKNVMWAQAPTRYDKEDRCLTPLLLSLSADADCYWLRLLTSCEWSLMSCMICCFYMFHVFLVHTWWRTCHTEKKTNRQRDLLAMRKGVIFTA